MFMSILKTMKGIHQNKWFAIGTILLCIFSMGTSYSASNEVTFEYENGDVIEVLVKTPWVSLPSGLMITSSKALVEYDDGLVMVPPHRKILVSNQNGINVITEINGHSVIIESHESNCFNAVVYFHTGSNLKVLKLFNIKGDGSFSELTKGISLSSNLGQIFILEDKINYRNQVVKDGRRIIVEQEIKISSNQENEECVLLSMNKNKGVRVN